MVEMGGWVGGNDPYTWWKNNSDENTETEKAQASYIWNVWDFMFVLETFKKWNKYYEIPQYLWVKLLSLGWFLALGEKGGQKV